MIRIPELGSLPVENGRQRSKREDQEMDEAYRLSQLSPEERERDLRKKAEAVAPKRTPITKGNRWRVIERPLPVSRNQERC
ncbi:MAG: hypothetical protein PHX30_05635 [Candidatus Pacebacteria bacterium]|jgi:hypothetical protein|nr:hypothetical protein [Candidatus Paceibacterota bacterium]